MNRSGLRCAVLGWLALAGVGCAQSTNFYHFDREFVRMSNAPGVVTRYQVIMAAANLTGIVGPTNICIRSNETFATEFEAMGWGYESALAAWTSALAVYPSYFQVHSNAIYDNAGWVKGTREAYGSQGSYVWYLQNTVVFTSSASSVYVDAGGATSMIGSVLVGTIGDYCPQTVVTDVGPVLDTNYLGEGVSTDYVVRADFDAYYKLVPFTYMGVNDEDTDGDGVPDFADGYNRDGANATPDDMSANDYFTAWPIAISGYADPEEAELRITYSASDPMGVTLGTNGYEAASGHYRLWTQRANVERTGSCITAGGSYVPAGTYAAATFGYAANTRVKEFYIEAVNPGANATLLVELDPDGPGPKEFACLERIEGSVLSVDLDLEKTTLTLMETNKLTAVVTPSNGVTVSQYTFEIKRDGSSTWYQLYQGSQPSFDAIAGVAGKFDSRVSATVGGVTCVSQEKDVEAQFPSASDILAGQGVQSRMDQAWTDTKNATTPTSRREEGYYITLDTSSGAYGITAHTIGTAVSNDQGAVWDTATYPRPPDGITNPTPLDQPTYTIGWFHTHTPTTYRSYIGLRPVGPSGSPGPPPTDDYSWGAHPNINVPGFVYDYTEDSLGSGGIPAGHPLNSSAQIYSITPPTRRPTP